jgi:hypothetical protein
MQYPKSFSIAVVLSGIPFLCLMLENAAAASQMPMPELPSASMEIAWGDMRTLIEAATCGPKKEAVPPAEWALANSFYTAQAISDAAVSVQARLDITVWKSDGWVKVPVIGEGVAVTSATADGEPIALVRSEGNVLAALLNTPGNHVLEATFVVPSTFQNNVFTFGFACVPTPVTHMTLTVSGPDMEVRAPGAASVALERTENALTADMVFYPTQRIEASWALPGTAEGGLLPELERETRIVSTVSTLVSVSEQVVSCESLIHYDFLRGETDVFRFRVPQHVNVLAVEGAGATWSESEEDGTRLVQVKLSERVQQRYDLTVAYEMPLDNTAITLKVPECIVEGVARQTGYLGVTAKGAVELTPNPETAGLVRTDVSELPVGVRRLSPSPILFAWKYVAQGYLLAFDMRRLDDIPMPFASVDGAYLTTVLTETGTAVTRVTYEVRNNVKQFLAVTLPQNADILGATVGGQPVKPARKGDTDTVLIPLLKSAETSRTAGTFQASLTYMERLPDLRRLLAKLDLRAPGVDVLSSVVVWRVFVPDGKCMFFPSGDLRPNQRFARRGTRSAVEGAATREKTLPALREGVERFMIADTAGRPAPTAASVAAGVLPIELELPADGESYGFRTVLVEQGVQVRLKAHLCGDWMRKSLQIVVTTIVFLLACRGGLFSRHWFLSVRRVKTLPLALGVAGVVGTLFVARTHPFAATLGWAMLLGFLVGLVWGGIRGWLSTQRDPVRTSDPALEE